MESSKPETKETSMAESQMHLEAELRLEALKLAVASYHPIEAIGSSRQPLPAEVVGRAAAFAAFLRGGSPESEE